MDQPICTNEVCWWKSKIKKPPLGMAPEFIYEENRMIDLCSAIIKYIHSNQIQESRKSLLSWIDELRRRIENYRKEECG